ncbi:MAG: electron transfer flavoprotein subunit beta/FixA family protein [Myxococcales bacterium]|nr:electron transfer flavoprotein subunit beta/FixA family protein [Myxococcales bacterium]
MKILVSAKRVSDPNARLHVAADGRWVEGDVEYILNPFCENAIEGALQLAEAHEGTETVVVGIGDEDTARFLRQGALARGIDRALLVNADEAAIDSDLIARIYAAVVAKEEPDIVLLGKQAVDCDSNQVAQLLAEYLGWPQATFASKIEVVGSEVRVTREVDGGLEVLGLTLPCVISADLRLNEPRYASLTGIMKAKKKPLDELELDDLGLGAATPKVRVVAMSTPPGRVAGVMVKDVDELILKLRTEARAI